MFDVKKMINGDRQLMFIKLFCFKYNRVVPLLKCVLHVANPGVGL